MNQTLSSELLRPETAAAASARRARLAEALRAEGLDGLVTGCDIDIRYLTGFVGEDTLVLATPERTWIVCDPRYDEYLEPWRGVDDVEVVMGVRHQLPPSLVGPADGLAKIGLQADHLTVRARAVLADALGPGRVTDTTGVIDRLRHKKDDLEVCTIERAIAIQAEALDAAFAALVPGTTERTFQARLDYEMRTRGAVAASFPAIVATGANSSVIHHSTGLTPIGPGALLVDWGATVDFHHSDLTRTFAMDETPPKIAELYDIVLEAQLAAIDAIAPGKTCAEIDAVARNVITRAGYGDFFGHGLGHGLGLEVHETPYFNDLETATRLEPGMVMTVEPGIYLPGEGGVRIEDDVLVTDTGCRVLGDVPKGRETIRRDWGAAAPLA